MSILFTSDTHFGHKKIIKYQPDTRGHFESIDEMDETLIKNWNKRVSPNDLIYHLGDFAFTNQARIRDILHSLNGDIHLITGNHDKAFNGEGFRKNLSDNRLIHTFCGPYLEVKINKTDFTLNHYSQRVWNKSHYGAIHLFGHSHGSLDGIGKSVDVGVDSTEMKDFTGETLCPWSLDEIMEFMETKSMYGVDHHKPRVRRK